MAPLVSAFNAACTLLFGLVYQPLKWLGPLGSLAIISVLAGVLMVWIFGKVSNQSAIQRTRDRLSGELLGLRLFKDDLRVFFRIQLEVLLWTVRYLQYSLVPMLILMVPTLLILIQLNLHYSARPLRVGEQALVKVKLRDPNAVARRSVTLAAPENVKIETDGLGIAALHEVCWRIRGVTPGRFLLTVSNGPEKVTKEAVVGAGWEGGSTLRTGEDALTQLLYPGERCIPRQSSLASIEIVLPELDLRLWGWHLNWLVVFVAVSLVFGYAIKGTLGVQI
jgi:hypothetical protein